MKQVFPVLMLIMLCVGSMTLAIRIKPVRAVATIVVPDDYSTIQAAINAANSGDTIRVRNGVYPEHIEVNKTVTLTGESNQNTIIETHNTLEAQNGVLITANNTVVENFRIVPPNSTNPDDIPTLVFIDGRAAPCSNSTVRNCAFVFATDLEAMEDALDIYGSTNNTVAGNLITIADKTDAGIAVLTGSSGNLIDNNTITGGWIGIECAFADHNTISNNNVTDTTLDKTSPPAAGFETVGSIDLEQSSGDVVRGNTLINNSIGLSVHGGDCSVYHNNFISNTQQALTLRDSQVAFDNGYPSGGNYWSDYNGIDSSSGVYQNITGKDGIGDTPYVINASNRDNYPLMSPWTHIIGDLNGDGKVGLDDLILLASAYDSKPGDSNWNPLADIAAPYGIISLTDLVTLGMQYGQHNP